MKEVYNTYFPDVNIPLIVSFVSHLREFGYFFEVDYDLYDFLVYNHDGELVMGVLSCKKAPTPREMRAILADDTPEKVVLVEDPGDMVNSSLEVRTFLRGSDVSAYLGGCGWAHMNEGEVTLDYSPWKFYKMDRYAKREDGEWAKQCSGCGEWKTFDNYYRRHRWGGRLRDPYRNFCKACWKIRYGKVT